MAPLPQLDLSLSSTDNPGSPMYAGEGEFEKMGRTDSALNHHKITIVITNEVVGTVTIDLRKKNFLSQIEIPTYKMLVTDDKTKEKTFYEVTRDTTVLENLKKTKSKGFSILGIDFFKKEHYKVPTVTFEPLKEDIEKFNLSGYRKMKEKYMYYKLSRGNDRAFIVCGNVPEGFYENDYTDNFFLIIDYCKGQKFIGDIKYREKFMKLTPMVEIHLMKRAKIVKELDYDKNGKVSKIIYL